MSFSQRLEEAIREWKGGGKRAFARAMQARDVRGSSYRTLVNYLSGTTAPSQPWLTAAAEELGVRYEWILAGEGAMTDPETGTIRGEGQEAGALREGDPVDPWDLFVECAPPELAKLAHHIIVSSWWNAVSMVLNSAPEREVTPMEVKAVGRWLLRQALGVAGSVRPEGLQTLRKDFNLFFNLYFAAVVAAAPPPGEGLALKGLLARIEGGTDGQA